MTKLIYVIGMSAIFVWGWATAANAGCHSDCQDTYSSATDDCHSQYGDDPDDADMLSQCVSTAKDDYDSCAEECDN